MQWNGFRLKTLVALTIAAALGLVAVPASADKPSSAGGGKGKSSKEYKNEKSDKGKKHEKDDAASKHGKYSKHFRDHDHDVVRTYYGKAFHKDKRCPPGLAKKHNGCRPPGQAKQWKYGYPLPRDVIFYDLPRQLVIELPAPPTGYRYVRVAADVLLIAIGTGMVIDAIQDLGSL
jgi:Ni/Co efflux regulator RcnB